jgi:deoxyribodipyrimidine photo-lyase
MIQAARVRTLNDRDGRPGDYVLYWMQASQRAEANHALQYAVRRANELHLPVVVLFALTDRFPEANGRHYAFLLQGLADVRRKLEAVGIRFILRLGSPERKAAEMAERAALAVVDRGYLRIQKKWRSQAAAAMDCPLIQVESDVVVPVETASPKEEWSAATLRAKVQAKWPEFLVPLRERKPNHSSLSLGLDSLDPEDSEALLKRLSPAGEVQPSSYFPGGAEEAKARLRLFLREKLDHFAELRNIPALDAVSHLSPYLHFGHISPLQIALAAAKSGSPGKDAFFEELLVRRELSMNFVHYNPAYDAFTGLPAWAQKTLAAHAADPRPVLYSRAELETARTHDAYWNAAQNEMRITGKMHGYMRMYWGKKILEWSPTPEEAFAAALYLNNKYEIDGRDPNGFAGVAWCFGKHDRPWGERPIFGLVRFMNEAGLRRKFDIDQYVRKIAGLVPSARP